MNINNLHAILTLQLPKQQLKFSEYAHLGVLLKFFEGETITKCCCGDNDLYLYYIISGSVRIYYQRNDNSQLDLLWREEGNIFQTEYNHYASILNDKLKISAQKNTVVSAFTKGQLYELIQKDKDLFDEFLSFVHITYGTFSHRIVNTAYLSPSEKILNWLNKLCEANKEGTRNCIQLPCSLTQQQIADLLFFHVTTCNKLFATLEKENLVKKTKSYIYINDWKKLKEYLEDDRIL